jgi:hypothetical protein
MRQLKQGLREAAASLVAGNRAGAKQHLPMWQRHSPTGGAGGHECKHHSCDHDRYMRSFVHHAQLVTKTQVGMDTCAEQAQWWGSGGGLIGVPLGQIINNKTALHGTLKQGCVVLLPVHPQD